jgi:hypothetical protein
VSRPAPPPAAAAAAPRARTPEPAPAAAAAIPRPATPPPAPRPAPAPPPAIAAPRRPSDPLRAFLEEVSKRRAPLAGYLESAEDLRFEEGRVVIVCPKGDGYLRSRLEASRAILAEAAASIWGPETRIDIVESRVDSAAPAAETAKPAGVQQIEQNPAVQAVLEIFPGSRVEVEAVEEQGSYTED